MESYCKLLEDDDVHEIDEYVDEDDDEENFII